MSVKVINQGKLTRIVYKNRYPAWCFVALGLLFLIPILALFFLKTIGLFWLLINQWTLGGFIVIGIGFFFLLKKQEIIIRKDLAEINWQTIKIKFADIKEFYIRKHSDNPQLLFKRKTYTLICETRNGRPIGLLPVDSNSEGKSRF